MLISALIYLQTSPMFACVTDLYLIVVLVLFTVYVPFLRTENANNSRSQPLEEMFEEIPKSRCLLKPKLTDIIKKVVQITLLPGPETTTVSPTSQTQTPHLPCFQCSTTKLHPTSPPSSTDELTIQDNSTPLATQHEGTRPTFALPSTAIPLPAHPPNTLPLIAITERSFIDPNGPSIQYILFQRDRIPVNIKLEVQEQIKEVGIIPEIPTKVIVHGYLGSTTHPEFTLIRDAYLFEGHHNVIGVDWSVLSAHSYEAALAEAGVVGALLGDFLNLLLDVGVKSHNIHIIGHGLGAHIGGMGASKVRAEVGRITALDPVIFGYATAAHSLYKLDPEDAAIVDAIHTNLIGKTIGKPHGKVEFYPNGGKLAAYCTDFGNVYSRCSHGEAYVYLAKAIKQPLVFQSQQCSSIKEAMLEQCRTWTQVYMGREETYAPGIFYVRV